MEIEEESSNHVPLDIVSGNVLLSPIVHKMEIEEVSPNHVSLDIVSGNVLLSSIKEKMEHISLSHCVSRVPEELYKTNEGKYFPSLVSIGPFHHGKHPLKLMEDQKWMYLNALLSRKPDAEATLDSCIRALRQVEHKARKFYGEPTDQMESDHLVEMLLLDGCFIIELFLEYAIKNLRRRDDPCFTSLSHLRCDLIMFENQLPFFILDQIFHLVPIPKLCHLSLIDLALYFFKKLIPNHDQKREVFTPQTHHLLDLIRQHYLPTSSSTEVVTTLPNVGQTYTNLPHASRLLSLGISVEKSISESPTNIQFFNGKLKIPSLEIHGYTEILFRNLIAMEHCSPGCSKHVTSYVLLMEGLIRAARDVRLLLEREILIDGHERENEIVFLMQRLHVDINGDDFYYRGLCEEVSKHQARRRDVWWVRMRDVYHRSQFGFAGFSVAVFLLVFLFTGAFFSMVYFLLHHFHFH